MADVGEEAALNLVQFHQLLVALLQRLAVPIQFEPEGELAEPNLVVKPTPANDEYSGDEEEIEIIEENAAGRQRVGMQQTCRQIGQEGQGKHQDTVQQRPTQQDGGAQHD